MMCFKNIKFWRLREFGQYMVANMSFSHFFHTYCCCSYWKSLHKKFDRMVEIQHWGKTDRHWTPAHSWHTGGQYCCLWNTTSKCPMNFWNTRQEGLQLMNQTNCFPLIFVRENKHDTCLFVCSGSCICRHHIILLSICIMLDSDQECGTAILCHLKIRQMLKDDWKSTVILLK